MTDPTPVRLVESAVGRPAAPRRWHPSWSTACRRGGRRSTGTPCPSWTRPYDAQLGDMAHVMFGGLTHAPALRLAERLVEISPAGLEHVFLADSGSVSVEVALKMVIQHQRGIGRPERTRMLTVRGGYHGDTFGCMSVCDPVGGMHSMFSRRAARSRSSPTSRRPRVVTSTPGRPAFRDTRGRARPRARRDHRRTGAPGRRRHARLRRRLPARDARGRRRARTGARPRRDRDRLRPHRHDVRRATPRVSPPTSCASARR